MECSNEDKTQYNQGKLDEIALALIHLNMMETGSAWKSIPWSATDRLHDRGYIFHPGSKETTFTLTDKGRIRAEELFRKHFTDEKVIFTNFPNAIVLEQNSDKDYILDISLHQLENAFEETSWKRKFFLNLETGEIEESFASALIGGIWLTIPGYASRKRNHNDDAQEEIFAWLKMNRITLAS